MGSGNAGFSGRGNYQYEKVTPPGGIKDVPRFLKELLGGFFKRLLYIFVLVWKTDPFILFTMLFISVFDGVMPVVGSVISADVMNSLQDIISQRAVADSTGLSFVAKFWGSTIMTMLIVLFTYRIINRVIGRISSAIIRVAGEKVVRQVKVQIMEKAKTLDLASFDIPAFYEKLENANREAGSRPIQTLQSTFSILSNVISLVSYIVILATIPSMWWMPLGIILISVPSAIVSFIYRRKNFQYMRNRSKDRRQMNYYADLLVNKDLVKEVRIFDLSDTFIDRYKEVFNRYFIGLRKLIISENVWLVVIAIISATVNCVFYAVIAYGVFNGDFKIGQYSLYTGALSSIAGCVTTLISTSASIYEGTLFIDNLISFMKEKQTIVPSVEEPVKVDHGIPHTITFEHVCFAYPGTDRYVINDLNTTFRPGETVVLVGLNGAGKTTLIKLLTRLYDPTEGRILLDGRDLKEYDVKDLYSIFGIIFQDFGKYAVTVSENIRFGDIHHENDPGKVSECAKQGNVSDYIDRLPNGYDTPLMRIFEPTGTELSGGQWQKLAIARAFYRDSDIMILDEPTASLDPMAEQEIFNQFDKLRAGKMTIFVSHRLSSAVIASKVVVLENGMIVEEGTHHELMEMHGKYYELFSTQARRYIEGGEDLIEKAGENTANPTRENAKRHEIKANSIR
ncbi:MAG: ABC transporter ATP-binding protein/permease [Clostridia bacterium]|nr:ABC transporter ATP-binding protein/permease [Clostridia bacterium]